MKNKLFSRKSNKLFLKFKKFSEGIDKAMILEKRSGFQKKSFEMKFIANNMTDLSAKILF
jgi:hypothetical protein